MMVMTEKPAKNGEMLPDIIPIQLFAPGQMFPERQFNCKGLYDAFETATVWLDGKNK